MQSLRLDKLSTVYPKTKLGNKSTGKGLINTSSNRVRIIAPAARVDPRTDARGSNFPCQTWLNEGTKDLLEIM